MSTERCFTKDILERDPFQTLPGEQLIAGEQGLFQNCIRVQAQGKRLAAAKRGEQERAVILRVRNAG
jgi:hypothetical protein